ncbi:MAG: hypothetical protein A4E65_00180 [Syntrophorhabdus sp. PtaU1.Bin153]|nr:MAG: hypothetical protein A4E65_00180 [Syntrophorhabdus sp. PtaU1.Bin153]
MEQEYTFKVTAKEADILFEALVELPFKKVADVFFKLRQQVTEAIQPIEPQPQAEGEKV